MTKRTELRPGDKRGLLTYIEDAQPRIGAHDRKHRQCVFQCDCGNLTTIDLEAWKPKPNGGPSCGCRKGGYTHGLSPKSTRAGSFKSPYGSWSSCRNRAGNTKGYENVSVDERWSTYPGFLANPPLALCPFTGEQRSEWFPGAVLARTGDTGDYTPENCRWATKAENAREAHLGKGACEIGKKVNMLTLIARDTLSDGSLDSHALFRCDCGNTKRTNFGQWHCGGIQSCGCLIGKRITPRTPQLNAAQQALIGTTRGQLTMLDRQFLPNGMINPKAIFQCTCGNRIETAVNGWKFGSVRSCGCSRGDKFRSHNVL